MIEVKQTESFRL